MRNINHKSDFLLVQHIYLKDKGGDSITDIGFPEYDFRLRYYTINGEKDFVAWCRNGHPVNCKNVDGKLIVIFNNHGMMPGLLNVDIEIDVPNDIFEDGYHREFIPGPTKVKLITGPTESFGMAEAEAMLPFIKGDPLKFEDLTPEELDELVGQTAKKAMDKLLDDADKDLMDRMDEIKEKIETEIEKDLTLPEEFSDDDIREAIEGSSLE